MSGRSTQCIDLAIEASDKSLIAWSRLGVWENGLPRREQANQGLVTLTVNAASSDNDPVFQPATAS